MGSSESTLSSSSSSVASSSLAPPTQHIIDEITTVTERKEGIDPLLQRFNSLQITPPILTTCSPSPTEGSFTDILIKKSTSSSSVPPGEKNIQYQILRYS
ncbi:hypothetical protein FRX31_029734 [Thalictrum thalictroides]|uniref:Uncharacterized protein n=1 Tax=Thalictrum thalictroides TaxID=46969 RepID=A0A7J6V6F8_THATH|nr:hypothetical protein FRX31_029734 [Thalictrum thalictroides]